jgi:hypothetical protein
MNETTNDRCHAVFMYYIYTEKNIHVFFLIFTLVLHNLIMLLFLNKTVLRSDP